MTQSPERQVERTPTEPPGDEVRPARGQTDAPSAGQNGGRYRGGDQPGALAQGDGGGDGDDGLRPDPRFE